MYGIMHLALPNTSYCDVRNHASQVDEGFNMFHIRALHHTKTKITN
jgi:hypothetical protein